AALALAAPAAHAADQPPAGATAGDGLLCQNGKPAWRVSLANSGPNQSIDYTVDVDGSQTSHQIGIGPLQLFYFPAKSGGSHLVVEADGAPMIDTTQSIECGDAVTTTTTTTPKTAPPTTVAHRAVAPATTAPAADPVVASGSASPTTAAPVVHAAATP